MLKVFTKDNSAEYLAFIEPIKGQLDIYYTPAFLQTDAELMDATFAIFTFNEGDNFYVYPYLKQAIDPIYGDGLFDLSSPYGYTGPFANTEDTAFLSKAELAFIAHCKEEKFVCEFVRYHPLINENIKFTEDVKNLENRTVVYVELERDWEDIWMKSCTSKCRNLVRKLEKDDYQFAIEPVTQESLATFRKFYNQTMDNAGADDFYYFNDAYYNNLLELLGENLWVSTVSKDGVIYATALFYIYQTYVNYFLSARNLEYPRVNGNNFVLSETIKWANEQGYSIFHLGGGRTNSPDDSLFKFKKNFSSSTLPFHIGKRVHNIALYQNIVNTFALKFGQDAYEKVKHILQFYRT